MFKQCFFHFYLMKYLLSPIRNDLVRTRALAARSDPILYCYTTYNNNRAVAHANISRLLKKANLYDNHEYIEISLSLNSNILEPLNFQESKLFDLRSGINTSLRSNVFVNIIKYFLNLTDLQELKHANDKNYIIAQRLFKYKCYRIKMKKLIFSPHNLHLLTGKLSKNVLNYDLTKNYPRLSILDLLYNRTKNFQQIVHIVDTITFLYATTMSLKNFNKFYKLVNHFNCHMESEVAPNHKIILFANINRINVTKDGLVKHFFNFKETILEKLLCQLANCKIFFIYKSTIYEYNYKTKQFVL